MPQIIDQLINGHRYDFSSIEASVGPRILTRFSSINYEHGVDEGVLRGTSPMPLGGTRGQYTASGSMTIYLEEWELLTSALLAMPSPGGFMEKRFLITVTYAEASGPPIVDTLEGVRITRARRGHSVGGDPLSVDCDLSIMRIIENAKVAVYSNLQRP